MSYIPDCRTDENYNQKYLNDHDKDAIKGYDWCAEEVVDNFFDNMDVYFADDSYLMHTLNEEVPEDQQEEYEMEYSFGEQETVKRTVKTYADLLRSKLLDWIEMQRDEIITSMLDGMNEDEYQQIKAEVDGRQGKAED